MAYDDPPGGFTRCWEYDEQGSQRNCYSGNHGCRSSYCWHWWFIKRGEHTLVSATDMHRRRRSQGSNNVITGDQCPESWGRSAMRVFRDVSLDGQSFQRVLTGVRLHGILDFPMVWKW